jgi:hypothetical protein
MEPSGRNRWQTLANAASTQRLRKSDRQPVATPRNKETSDGKEEVDGSSLSEGSTRLPARAEGHPLSGETSEDAVLQGIQADDGTRTHGLLHGKGWRAFAPVRLSSPKTVVCGGFEGSERTEANPSERSMQPLLPL